MKKILMIIILISSIFNTAHAKTTEQNTYSILKKKIENAPQIIEFFSFLCPHCYFLEKKYHLNYHIKKQISNSIKIVRYHVNFLGGELGNLLTHIWEISKMIKLEEKVLIPIFEKVQKTKTIKNFHTLKNEFLKLTNINEKEFQFLWNNFVIKSIIYNQEITQQQINLNYVPCIIINGKYIINNESINYTSLQNTINTYINIIKTLLKKNNTDISS
ncbi:MAG: DsbA family protein [Buchnera aphidicola (Schlechtendalia peitan)]